MVEENQEKKGEKKGVERPTVPSGWTAVSDNELKENYEDFTKLKTYSEKLEERLGQILALKKRKPKPVKVKAKKEVGEFEHKNPFFWLPVLVLVLQALAFLATIFLGFHWSIIILSFALLLFVFLFVYAGSSWIMWLWYQFRKKKDWGFMLKGVNGSWTLEFVPLPEEQKFPYKDEAGVKREEKTRVFIRKWLRNLGTQMVIVKAGYPNSLDLDAIDLDEYYPDIALSRERAQNNRMALKSGMELMFDEGLEKKMDIWMYVLFAIVIILIIMVLYYVTQQPEMIKQALSPLIEGLAHVSAPASSITPGG